jgi:hypothetical protein
VRLSALGLLALAAPISLTAQASFETGGGAARLDQLPAGAVTVFGGRLDDFAGPLHMNLASTTADYRGLGGTASVDASVRYPFDYGAWRFELGPVGSVGQGIDEELSRLFGGALAVQRDLGPVTVTGEWQEGRASIGMQRAGWGRRQLAGEMRFGPFLLKASWLATLVRDSVLRKNVFFDPRNPRVDTLYEQRIQDVQDGLLQVGWGEGRWMLDARVGRRSGAGLATRGWWQASASVRIFSSVAVVVNSGRAPADLLLGLRGGQRTTLGLRFGSADRPFLKHRASRDILAGIEMIPIADRGYRMVITLPGVVRNVRLSSDLTGWKTIPLEETDDGRWKVELEAPPGVYRLNIRIDNGPWTVPPGVRVIDDGFGGTVGLLVVDH